MPGVGSYAEFTNPSEEADPRRVLIFGDSAANYRSYLLTGMLAETFRHVHFAWAPFVDWPLVDRVRPDIVITELVERSMGWSPRDAQFDFEAISGGREGGRAGTDARIAPVETAASEPVPA